YDALLAKTHGSTGYKAARAEVARPRDLGRGSAAALARCGTGPANDCHPAVEWRVAGGLAGGADHCPRRSGRGRGAGGLWRSGTLFLGDRCMNIGPDRPLLSRAFVRLDGVYERFAMPRTIRLTVRNRRAARLSLERMLDWDFDRIVVGHGDVVESGGRQALAD